MRSPRPLTLAAYSLLPVVLLLVSAETAVRLARLDRPAYYAGGLGSIDQFGSGGMSDVDLGWRGRPGYRAPSTAGQPAYAHNSLGLRSPEVGPKGANELRILSLGESSTVGVGVEGGQTYSARLQEILGNSLRPRPVTVINAGVSGYSSFQSLKYLELRGLALEPDLVLFYHELNDYLPSTIRDPEQSEVEVLLSDRQIYDSGLVRVNRWFLAHSALYRLASYQYSRRRIGALMRRSGQPPRAVNSPLPEIGLPATYNLVAGVFQRADGGGQKLVDAIHPATVGRRVTSEERLDNLRRLAALCREKGLALVIMHPSYRQSSRHECLLTRFCADNGIPLFETHDVLHPGGSPPEAMFRDSMHPNASGHAALAEGLAPFILDLLARTGGGRR